MKRESRKGTDVLKNIRILLPKGDVFRRVFALFLACVMLFSATPVQAFAQEDISYLIEETNPQEDVNLIEDTGLTETVNLGEDINLSGDTGPSEGTELSENTNTTEDSELIIEGEESEANPLETEGEESEANPTETEGEEAIEETVQTEMEDPIDDTELLEGTETTENLQPEETLPKDITNCMDQLTLSMKKWWYEDQENTVDVTEEKYVDFSEFIQDPDEPVWAGVSLKYEAVGFQEGDWFTVVLPEQFEDVQIEEGFVFPEGMEGSLKELEEPEQGTELTMRFSTVEETFDGELPLQFRLSALEDVSILLQEDADRQNEYVVIPPFAETEQEGMVGVFSLRSGKAETNTFSIKGEIVFDENLGGTDWRSILRPLEFDQNIKLIATYQDASGVDHTVEYYAQDSAPQDAFYLMMTHDGEGGGSFEIINVPKKVTLENGVNAEVTKYNVSVDTQYPYYENENGGFDVTDMGATQTVSTLRLKVKSQNLTLDPNVVGDQTPATFPMDVTFTKSSGAVTEQSTLSKTVNPTNTAPTIIQVPVGIGFKVVQNQVEGYKLDPQYTITTETVGSEPVSDTKTGEVTGTIVEGTNVTVTTKNYMQNLTYPLSVIWVDNNNSGRPVLGESSFKLQYKTESGEWTDLTEASKETLGIDNLPTFDASNAALGKYVYRGLPSIDAEGNSLSYQVVPFDLPGYTVSANEMNTTFTYRQTTTFNATISWKDSDNADNKRPDALPLNLYRRAANGSYELVSGDVPVNKNSDNTWSVSVPDLPRYNDSNQEYDYVLVQGTIGENNTVTQTTIDSYKTFYDNGTGNYGNDIALCHNGGTISQRISGVVDFSATKKWKDNVSTTEERPETTVTLWRYSVPKDGDHSIDTMYNSGLAAQVIYRKTTTDASGNPTYQDVLLSYQLNKQDGERITFDQSTVHDLPDGFKLPAYDEQGRKYVYFVRETVDSEYYETSYTSNVGVTFAQGAPNGGTITNTRREKSAVNITKVWQCPSNLPDIEGVSVQMKILAPDQDDNYEELTVYSAKLNSFDKLTGDKKTKAQTLSGFAESIATLDLQFYVNIYDENGLPYDMTKAVIQEIKVLDKNKNEIDVSYSGEANLGIGTFTLEGNQYTAASAYINQTVLADGMKQFQYKETNTITGERNYTLIKKWQGFEADELNQYASVSFKLTRRSSKDGASYEQVNTPGGETTWLVTKEAGWQSVLNNLPKYDNQGYEYLYSAEEVAVKDTSGNTVTQNWSSYHYRTEDSTTVTNYRGTGGGGAFFITKTWMDNGDTEARKAVSVRIYRKSDVLNALQEKRDEEVVDLNSLNIGYASCQLSSENNWFCEIALSAVENEITQKGGSSVQSTPGVGDYLILEYQVGGESDGAHPASYTVSQLKSAIESASVYTYNISGTVSNSQRQYETLVNRAANGMLVTITNIRIGQASLEVTKNWFDENNVGGIRPNSVQFQVYQDGQVYMPGVNSGIGQISGDGATWDPATGIITVSRSANANTDSNWFLRLKNLPLFSETGVPHTYNVEEIEGAQQGTGGKSQTGNSSYYLSTKGNITVKSHESIPDRVTYGFSFDNTLTGTTVHSAHKTWNDIDSGGFDRPDLYLTLYRYLKSDAQNNPTTSVEALSSYEKYSDCEDPIWTVDGPYHWRAEVTGLPRYDNQGREYVYRFQEALNNNGVTVYGTYVQTAEYHLVVECETCKNLNISYSIPYDKFTNTLTDNMTVSGVKTWKGFEGYEIEQKDYPTVTIELYRSLNPNINPLNKKDTDAEFQQWKNNGTIEIVTQAELSYDVKNDTYPTTYSFGTESNPLPKFNGEGRRWYYSIREVFPDTITNSLYTENFDNGTLTNVFLKNGNRRTIQVMKTWNRGELLENEKDKYPSVTYYLYRYEEGVSPENAALLKSIQVSANDVAANANWAATGEGQEKPPLCEFKDLLIYSPSGKPYYYYVTEKAISGYSISYSDEAGIGEGYSGNRRSDVISIPENPFTQESDHTVKVGTTNTYDNPGLLNISGKKYWNDYGNSDLIYGNRPDSIEVTLKRYTQNESGQANMVSEETIELLSAETQGKPYILWEKSVNGDKNYWKYTIHNLERYAPNGMPYIYSVTETPVEGYKQSNGTVSGSVGTTGDLSLAVLTNSLGTTYYVRKNWMDGNNRYGLRPTSITVVLQRSNDGGSTWQNIPWESSFGTYDETAKKWTGLPSVTTDESGNKIVSIKLTADYVMNNTKGNSWQYTFANLPEKDKDGKNWTYRCIETKIDNAAVEEKNNIFKAGAYTCTYPTQDGTKTVIQNKLESTSLYVTKNWVGDNDDLYHSRPDSITFVLQMRGIVQTDTPSVSPESGGGNVESGGASGEPGGSEGNFDLSDWQNVKVNGQDYTFTISKAENWQKTLQDLPVAIVGEDGRTYYTLYFRAVEKHVDDTVGANGNTVLGSKVLGAQNYEDKTKYDLDSPDHSYNETLSRNESKITNELILDNPAKSISVTKNWKRQSGESVTATFELLYKTVEEGENSWHCFGNQSISGTWTGHTKDNGCVLQTDTSTDTCTNTVTWLALPKYDRDGKELVYKVVEHPIAGYKIEYDEKAYTYTFTNIELQNYTVKKKWQNTDYAEKEGSGFTATFQLQQKIADGEWNDVEGKTCTLISITANDKNQSYTWAALPKYTTDGTIITYRAVETKINGVGVDANNTNGSYIVSYQYNNGTVLQYDPAFAGTETVATNRMVYGFVNLSKAAAYLAPGVTPDGSKKLKDVVFDIYSGTGTSKTLYASGIKTDDNGTLIRNDDGTYGTEHKYLISGTYTLMERSTNPGYSVWKDGVTFTVGVNGPEDSTNKDTGEHGTAWISTNITGEGGSSVLNLNVEYKSSGQSYHTFGNTENCTPQTNSGDAYNLESRGVIEFTKTGPNGEALDIHAGASGESKAYFGVYTDAGCTKQVAGMMADSTGTKMVLTTFDKDGITNKESEFCSKMNTAGIPYLRKSTDNLLTLLSGTYYLKELVAPPGYKLDTTVREVTVNKIDSTNLNADLSSVYLNNKAEIEGSDSYQWANTKNVVKLYKRDQYGRKVALAENEYLELKVEDGNTFPTGTNTIKLYQNADNPASVSNYISYVAGEGAWTITGLFDIGKTYTLSEPDTSVHPNNVVAKPILFKMNPDGTITVTSNASDTVENSDPLAARGDDYVNYYKPDAAGNIMVMRDATRYLKDVALEKLDSNTNDPIQNISFKLYKYEEKGVNGIPVDSAPVLEENVYLTTDENGKIVLSDQPENVKNLITGCALKYGLDIGKYYFQEVERGASDRYRLVDDIYFEIKAKDGSNLSDYSDYAEVEFDTTNSFVTQEPADGKTGTVKNDPVTAKNKSLILTKVDNQDPGNEIKLSNARFELTYTSVTVGDPGSVDSKIYNCITNGSGELYLTDESGSITSEKPDISRKGSYVLKEIQAPQTPNGYMTRTEDGTANAVTMVTFNVNSENEIVDVTSNVTCYDGNGNLVTDSISKYKDEQGKETSEHQSLNLTVKNEKTIVSVAKRNDIQNSTKSCDQKSLNGEPLTGATLQIYEGTTFTESTTPVATLSGSSDWDLTQGTLKENIIYTLHESVTPVGYLTAKDIYFKLFGTTIKDNKVRSQLYVWTGTGTPTSVEGDGWSTAANLNDSVLTMVDEAIIAPVDLQKVLESRDGTSWSAVPGVEFTVTDGTTTLGIAETTTDSKGYLVWKSITSEGYSSGVIFNADGKRVAAFDSASVINKTIILRQNAAGYVFTETKAPDYVYNDGRSYHVSITADNYREYRTGNQYQTDKYINLVEAEKATDHQVSLLSTRGTRTTYTGSAEVNNLAVNKPYKSTVTLHKYDADEEANNVSIPGTEFTLYHASESGGTWTKGDVVTDAFVTGIITPNASGVFTTDASGNLSIEIHNKGYYILEETKAATGYELSNVSFQFQLIDDTTQPYGYNKSTSLQETGVPNERQKGTVTLMKKDIGTREALNGVVFTLTRTNSPTGISDYLLKTPLEVTTGKVYEPVKDSSGIWTWKESAGTTPGQITVTGLNWGDYKLKEKTEKSGYIRSDTEYSFKIKAKVKADDRTFHYDVFNEKNQVTFYKTDDAGSKGLAGAVFEVHEGGTCSGSCRAVPFYTSDSATTTVNSVVSGSDGKVTIYGLPTDTSSDNPKKYHLVETTAPKGYKLASPVSFTIDRSGKVQVNTSYVTEVQMKDEPIELYIKKIGEDSSVTLAGAQFQLTDICKGSCDHKLANGGDSETVTTEAGGNVMIPIERVIAGHTYQLEETKAPDGYECTAVVTFKVKEDGTAELLSTSGGHTAAELDSNKTTFTISNEKIQVSLTKVDYEDSKKKLGGVTFTLKPAEDSGFVEGYPGSIESDGTVKLTTDPNGTVRIPLELMKHDNSYILTETSLGSNSSYRLAEHEADRQITFKVEKGGTITITKPNDMFQLDQDENGVINAAALIVSNQKITLTVDKQNQATGEKLKDVTLKLSKQDTNGNWNPVSLSGITGTDGQWTTNDTRAVTFIGDNFTPGTYKLEEVSTPEGYNSIVGPLTFTIDQSGKVTKAAVGNDLLTGLTRNSWNAKNFTITNPVDGKSGGITLNVSNAAYTDLQIIKEGSDGVLLNGVEFRLDYWDGTQWQYVNLDNTGKAVVTDHVLTSGGIENAKRTTDTNGIVIFSGLPNGKYRLTELKTAQGYNLLSAPLEIEIDRNGEIYKVSYNGGKGLDLTRGSETKANTISLTVINQKGFVLPATGTTTPQLPKAVLGWIALMEGLVLYQYQLRGKRRKRKG